MDAGIQEFMTQVVTGWVRVLPTVAVLIALIGLDIVTGLVAAVVTKTVASETSYRGMMKKVMELLVVASGLCVELIYPAVPWGTIIAGFLCLTEAISIMENAVDAGLELPEGLVATLKHLRQSGKRDQFKVHRGDTAAVVDEVDPLAGMDHGNKSANGG